MISSQLLPNAPGDVNVTQLVTEKVDSDADMNVYVSTTRAKLSFIVTVS